MALRLLRYPELSFRFVRRGQECVALRCSGSHPGSFSGLPTLHSFGIWGAPAVSYLTVVNYVISTHADQLIRQPADQLRGTPGHSC
jgi:hypothetical protein